MSFTLEKDASNPSFFLSLELEFSSLPTNLITINT
jgi:hypothetical protein